MSIITATLWVPRGFAAQFPTKYDIDEAEFSRISKLAKLQLDDAREDLKEARQDDGSEEEIDSLRDGVEHNVKISVSTLFVGT